MPALESPAPEPEHAKDPKVDLTAPGKSRRERREPFDPAKATVVDTKENVRTYRNPDGTITQRLAAGQKWFKDAAGEWQEVDLELAEAGDGRLKPKASPTGLHLGLDGSRALAEVASAGQPVSFWVEGMNAAAHGRHAHSAAGDSARFDGGGPAGVDVKVQPLTRGFESTYTFASADQAGQEIRERFDLPQGWRARQAGTSVEFVNELGDVAATFGGGEAYDSAATVSRVPVVSTLVSNGAGKATIVESVDPTWLSSAERVYPIVVDPIYNTGEAWAGDWTAVASDPERNGDLDTSLRVGDWGVDAAQHRILFRSLLQFAPADFNQGNAGVVDATLYLKYKEKTASCVPKQMLVRRNLASQTAKTWNGMPLSAEPGQVPWTDDCSSLDREIELTDFADYWTKRNGENYGVTLFATDEGLYNSGRGFRSADDGAAPTLDVTFEHLPGKVLPTGPADKSVIMTTTPTLSVTRAVHDTDFPDDSAHPTFYFYRLTPSPDAESGEQIGSGWIPDWPQNSATSWTVPSGYLHDGTTYYWHTYTWDNHYPYVIQEPSPVQSFRIDMRLGAGGPSPSDSVGPVSVNLATGNLSFSTATPSFAAVGGAQSFTASYNSLEPSEPGLSGAYYSDADADGVFDATDPLNFRATSPSMDFNWGSGPPASFLPADYFLVRWNGFFTAPFAGSFSFGAVHDDGVKLWYGDTSAPPALDEWNTSIPLGTPHFGSPINLYKGQVIAIKAEYREITGNAYMQLYVNGGASLPTQIVPSSMLSTTTRSLPQGWNFSTDLDGDLMYSSAKIGPTSVTLYSPDGSTTAFSSVGTGGWKGPADQDATLTKEGDGTLSLFAEDGRQYRFDPNGNLIGAVSVLDIKTPAAPLYTYGTLFYFGDLAASTKLTQIQDPVSGRVITLEWGYGDVPTGNCRNRTAPPGVVATAPIGMLCRINYWDGTSTNYWYNSNGQLARIDDPGVDAANPESNFFRYATNGKIDQIRDARAADFIAATLRADDDSTRTRISYATSAPYKVTSVRLPDPTVGALPVQHNYTYFASQAYVDIAGFTPPTPPAHARIVNFDSAGRLTSDTDPSNLTTTKTWRAALEDLPIATTGPDGLRSTTVYDYANRPSDTWGPSPSGWFNADGTPQAAYQSQIPHATTAYDEGMQSLNVSYYDNASLNGAAKAIEVGVGDASGRIVRDYNANPPPLTGLVNGTENFSLRATGEIRLTQAGVYGFHVYSDDGARLFIDDTLVAEDWTAHAPKFINGTFNNAGDSWHRIRLEYFNLNQTAVLDLQYSAPNGGTKQTVPGAYLKPRYGLTTSQTDPDGKVTTTEYANPQFGQATATVQDPGASPHLNLRSQTAYEPLGSGYFRVQNTTMPKGGVTTSTYYGNTDTVTDPCGYEAGTFNQGGALKQKTDPDPDGANVGVAPITREYRYDNRGRVIAQKVLGDANWTCTDYDGRGRVEHQKDSQGNVTTFIYTDPTKVVTQYTDWGTSARQTTAESDLLGRATKYTDEHGSTTRTVYDQMGREIETWRALFGGTEAKLTETHYRSDGKVDWTKEYASGTARQTTYQYDAATGRPTVTTLPNGITTTTGYDANSGAVSSLNHANASGALSNWSYTRSYAGRITSETGANRVRGFTYDAVGRLTQVTEGPVTRRYAYDANTNRCNNAATCTAPTFTYDNADRILTSPYATSYTYDAHGNTTAVNYSGAQPSGAINDTASFDLSTPSTARTFPVIVGRSGAISATTNWTPSQPALRTGSWSPSIAGGTNQSIPTPMTVYGQSELGATMTWPQAIGNEPINDSGSVTTTTPKETNVTPNVAGTLNATVSWPVVNKTYAPTGLPTLTSTAPTWTSPNFVVSGQGAIKLDLTWAWQLNNPNLKLELFEVGNATAKATSDTSSYIDDTEHINWTLNPTLSYPNTRSFYVKVTKTSGANTTFTFANTSQYPIAPNVNFQLIRISDNFTWNSTQVTGATPSRTLSVAVAANVAYKLKTTTADVTATATITGSKPNQAYPNLKLELRKPGNGATTSVTSSTGSLTFPSWFSGSTEGGGWTWKITNLSASSYTATPTVNWSATTRGFDLDSGGLAVGQMIEKTVVPDANGTLDTSLVWSIDQGGANPNLRLALKNSAGTELLFATGSSGSLTLPSYQAVSGTTYKIAVTNNAGSPGVRSFTRTAILPSQGSHKLELVDPDGVVKLSATGRKPQSLAGNVAPGTYTLRDTPISGVGSVSTTATFPGRVPGEVTTFDANDHAITIDDGTTKVSDYLSPSGRVIRRVVAPSGGGTPTEDTLFGYDDGGDSPAYSAPNSGHTPVTTYLDGAIDIAGTITYQHSNLHGDIIGTSNSAGVFTVQTPADEFGLQEAQNTSRLGWLGKQRRFEVGVNNLIRMGVRLYDPRTGRFTSVDPIEGGSANDYDYVYGDPINHFDLDGTKCGWRHPGDCVKKAISKAAGATAKFAAGVAAGKRYLAPRGLPGGWLREAGGRWVTRLGAKGGAAIASGVGQFVADSLNHSYSIRKRLMRAAISATFAAGAVALTGALCSTGVGCVAAGFLVSYAANQVGSRLSRATGYGSL